MRGQGRPVQLGVAVAAVIALLIALAPSASSLTAAQSPCAAESEPNDTEQVAPASDGPLCIEGTLPADDQDLVVWKISDGDSATRWTVRLQGVPGTQTLLQVFAVTSEPSQTPLTVERVPILELVVAPEKIEPEIVEGLLLPAGRYLVGLARSGLPGGGEPSTFDYRYSIEPGTPWPPIADQEPNDDSEDAGSVADAFEIGGDRAGSLSDFYRWTVEEPERRWDLSLDVALGDTAWLDLQDADGQTVDSVTSQTSARFYDLALEPGTYLVRVKEAGEGQRPYILRAIPSAVDGDPEPNEDTPAAVSINDGEPVRGRLAKEGDRDRFTLTVPGGEPMLRDVRLLWRSGNDRELCLLDDADMRAVCSRTSEGLGLPNLLLRPGEHTFDVSGASDPDDPYLLRVDVTGPTEPDFETEPNQTVDTATAIDPSLGMTARGGPADADLFRLQVEGEPQLWQVDLAGSGISRAELVRASGVSLASADIADDGSSASLSDLYLVPGDHWLRVSSTGPEYAITTTPLGPPDPDGEWEPNDTAARAQGYRVGSRRIGRLPTQTDRDLYRFTLAAPQRIRLRLAQAPDASTGLRLWTADERVSSLEGLPVGETITYDLWLQAGDHIVELYPEQVSEGSYELTSERLDPFSLGADQEPNDVPAWAGPVPASLSWAGSATDPDDQDWYSLPPASAPEPLRISLDGDTRSVRLSALSGRLPSGQPIQLQRGDDGVFVSVEDLPPGAPLLLVISAAGDYRVSLEGAGLVGVPTPDGLDLAMRWSVPVDSVASYWPEEQIIDASLEMTNSGSGPVELMLETATSHYQWRAIPASDVVSLAAGDSLSVSTMVVAGADAWGTEPVLISARATTGDGASVTASAEIGSSPEAPPSHPVSGWAVPEGLLGGLNVASVALGAVPGGTLDPDSERRLFDGVTPEGPTGFASQLYGNGFNVFVDDYVDQLPIEFEVDLAGDVAIPVVGTIINPQASQGELRRTPRDFELLLSADGRSWEPVLEGTLAPLRIDQTFALDEPMAATHAKLRIWSKYVDQGAYLSLGEWKIVAAPGTPVGEAPIDLADPALGGHVVSFEPFVDDAELGPRMLDAQLLRETIDVGDRRAFDMVVGFQDGRAAQVTSLTWIDPEESDPLERLARLEVSASTRSPTGPWQFLGAWDLSRAADGSVPEFDTDGPTWVRYLRLTGRLDPESPVLELPGELRVMERPTDESYRSIVGEWGYRSRSGPYEWLEPADPIVLDESSDAGDVAQAATELDEGSSITDRAEIDVDEDWYWVDVPADRNTLELVVGGRPSVGVALTLFDVAGDVQPMEFSTASDGTVRYRAKVEPERRYALQVEQPPFSAVFAFDTSSSMDPFLDMVTQGMRSFLADVRPGREAVTVVPFEDAALVDDWQDDPYLLQDAFENHVVEGGGSSGAEAALIDAADRLADREGSRAVLLVTDAETTTLDRTPELWAALGSVRPIIFSVHIGALVDPLVSRQRMQDWAAAGGGHYAYPTTHGEMDRAFERMATWLRRPAVYTLAYETLEVLPGTLAIRPAASVEAAPAAALAPDVGVEIILDTSASMRKKLGGKRRIDIAKASLRRLIDESLSEGVPLAIRTFGGPGSRKQAKCATSLTLPLGPLDRAAALTAVKALRADKKTATPIAAALLAVSEDLAEVAGLRNVVLVTDGNETCKGDPAAAIAALRDAGIEVKLDIVGFALKDESLKAQMAEWAAAGGGTYFDAAGAAELAASIATAVSAPFRVYGPEGETVATGTVGAEPVELDPGSYRVEILTEPPIVFEQVELGNGESVTLELPAAER